MKRNLWKTHLWKCLTLLTIEGSVLSSWCGGIGVPAWVQTFSGNDQSPDHARAIALGTDGRAYVGGTWTDVYNDSACVLIAYSIGGTPLWTNWFAGSPWDNQVKGVAVGSNGGIYMLGFFAAGTTGYDYVLVAYSPDGSATWTNYYDGPVHGADYAAALAVDRNYGNIYVTGSSAGTSGDDDYATIAYSSEGIPLWTNRYVGPTHGNHCAEGIAVDSNSGNVYVTGFSQGMSGEDYATIAYSRTGVPLWTNRYDGGADGDDVALAVATDGNGTAYVTGASYGGISYSDYATIAYSASGIPLWTNRYSGAPVNEAHAIATGDGNVYVTGHSGGVATIAYSGEGTPLWTNRCDFAEPDVGQPTPIGLDGCGNIYVTGTFAGDYVTLAYSSVGTSLWTNRFSAVDAYDEAQAMAVDPGGNVYVTGDSVADGLSSNFNWATIRYAVCPLLTFAGWTPNGCFVLALSGSCRGSYRIEKSADLIHWQTLTNIPAGGGVITNADSTVRDSVARFYRAVWIE